MTRRPHPEATSEEVFIGNLFPVDFRLVGWTTKRMGVNAFDRDGVPLSRQPRFRPVFVQRQELVDAGVAIADVGAIDHRYQPRQAS